MAVLRNNHIFTFGEVFKTSLTSSNSFNVCFAILLTLLTLCCIWLTIQKAHGTPTNSNTRVSSKVIEMRARGHIPQIHTPSNLFGNVGVAMLSTNFCQEPASSYSLPVYYSSIASFSCVHIYIFSLCCFQLLLLYIPSSPHSSIKFSTSVSLQFARYWADDSCYSCIFTVF